MRARALDEVLRALARLGCPVHGANAHHVFLSRGAVKIARLAIFSPVPAKVQRNLLAVLEIDEADYLAALEATP